MSISLFQNYVSNAKPYFNIWGELWVVLTFIFRIFTILLGSAVYTKECSAGWPDQTWVVDSAFFFLEVPAPCLPQTI